MQSPKINRLSLPENYPRFYLCEAATLGETLNMGTFRKIAYSP